MTKKPNVLVDRLSGHHREREADSAADEGIVRALLPRRKTKAPSARRQLREDKQLARWVKHFTSHSMQAVSRMAIFLFTLLAALCGERQVFAKCGIAVGGEWIYFSLVSESIQIAELVTFESNFPNNVTSVDGIQNRFDRYRSGYRIFASYELCRFSFYGRYTHLRSHHRTSVTATPPKTILLNSFSMLLTNFASFVGDSKTFRYEAADGLLGWRVIDNCLLSLEAFGGVHYAYLRDTEQDAIVVNLFPATVPFISIGSRNTSLNGAGPEVGASILGHIGWGFSLHGTASGGFITGKSLLKDPFNTFNLTTGALIAQSVDKARSEWRTVPFGDLRIGLRYRFCLPFLMGIGGSIEGGYEGLAYYQALLNTGSPGVIDSRTFRDVVMHGPYVSAAIWF